MAIIQVISLSFCYEGAAEPVFSGLDFHMDSSWRLGLIGRNGRGKTTLLRLLSGELQGQGEIKSPLCLERFPLAVIANRPAQEALIDALLPYTCWEADMQKALQEASPKALSRYGEIEQLYSANGGYQVREMLLREAGKLGFSQEELRRDYASFSPGEQTRLCLAALFLRPGRFVLMDEPTNHLDQEGRQLVTQYLSQKRGFLLASHDRDLLDAVCTHTLALEKQGARVMRGNYSVYRENKRQEDQAQKKEQQETMNEVARLKAATQRLSQFASQAEAAKFGPQVPDRGFAGSRAARVMKKAKNAQARAMDQMEQAQGLLLNLEYTSPLSLNALPASGKTLLRLTDLSFSYGDAPVLSGIDLSVKPGERLHLAGGNGTGKSTLLKIIHGELAPDSGTIWRMPGLVIATQPQTARHLVLSPRQTASALGLNLTRFLMFLRKFDLPQEAFDLPCQSLSLGQKKKVLLALALSQPAHLYLFDEPTNDIDIQSREQMEEMLTSSQATVLFVEHEQAFVRACRTRSFCLDPAGDKAL